MKTARIRKFGNSFGILLPKETMDRLRAQEGDTLYLTESQLGISMSRARPDFEAVLKAGAETRHDYVNALKALAKK